MLLVRYAKAAGALVVGLAGGPGKTSRVRAEGADLAVGYREPDWPERVRAFLREHGGTADGRGADVLFDGVGGETARTLAGMLRPGGRHIVFGWSSEGIADGGPVRFPDGYLAERGVTSEEVLGPVMMEKAGGPHPIRTLELRALAEAAAGRLVPAVQRYPLAEAAAAHRDLESRATVGKVVLEP
ncbi:hypothetical protein Sm713_01180 [Streptomyces sp. TS71-3]|nr:hypothetical protein Sm713_01180 [Streptomyces sp. TS71-3]